MYEFKKSLDGIHQIGGKKPDDLKYPENKFKGDFQYIGFLDQKDDVLKWLPFDLHIICPIYLNIERIYLDYNDSSRPKLIYPTDSGSIDSEYDVLTLDSYIEFESVKIALEMVSEIDDMDCIGIVGEPIAVQELDVPICPLSNKQMRFVCQLMTFGEITTKGKNIESRYPEFDNMCFWGDGSLFVYMEPDAKTVCYFIQNT